MLRALALLLLTTSGCGAHRTLTTTTWAGEDPTHVVVMLPPLLATDRAFGKRGLVASARSAGVDADLVGVHARLGHYARETLVDRVRVDLLPTLRERYDHVHLVGISLGGLGALHVAAAEPEAFDGVVALSPFLGTPFGKRRVTKGGGLRAWRAPLDPDLDDRLWARVQPVITDPEAPPAWLGVADHDPLVGRPGPLADALPPGRLVEVDGGHGWRTWRTLLTTLVERGALQNRDDSARPVSARLGYAPAEAP